MPEHEYKRDVKFQARQGDALDWELVLGVERFIHEHIGNPGWPRARARVHYSGGTVTADTLAEAYAELPRGEKADRFDLTNQGKSGSPLGAMFSDFGWRGEGYVTFFGESERDVEGAAALLQRALANDALREPIERTEEAAPVTPSKRWDWNNPWLVTVVGGVIVLLIWAFISGVR
jgi:hypothetical protein